MNMKTVEKFTATITLGKIIGYTDKEYSTKELYSTLQKHQKSRIKESNVYLSTFVHKGDIVMSGQIEPHYRLEFINYPRFTLSENVFKDEVMRLGKHLMTSFKQNRLVINFHNDVVMLEENQSIDPKILMNA